MRKSHKDSSKNGCHWGGTISKCTNMYLQGTNKHLLVVNKQKCTFWKGAAPVTAFVPFFENALPFFFCVSKNLVI